MKKSDLYREWARVLDMCDGTEVDPSDCAKYDGNIFNKEFHPAFKFDVDKYVFSVAILEGKPVFVGDVLFHKHGHELKVCEAHKDNLNKEYVSWNPPKKKLMLNGEELPCPVATQGGEVMIIKVGNQECHFMFESGKDADKVMTSIYNLLIGSIK